MYSETYSFHTKSRNITIEVDHIVRYVSLETDSLPVCYFCDAYFDLLMSRGFWFCCGFIVEYLDDLERSFKTPVEDCKCGYTCYDYSSIFEKFPRKSNLRD